MKIHLGKNRSTSPGSYRHELDYFKEQREQKITGRDENMAQAELHLSEGKRQTLTGVLVIAADLVINQFVDIPEPIDTILLGGAGAHLIMAAQNFVVGKQSYNEARRWR
jgi:hypothetical protein